MPGMSGFEFLPLARSQLPATHLIAMSGAFSGTCVPPGVVADAFFAKGSDPALLIKTVEAMTQPGLTLSRQLSMEYPARTSTAHTVTMLSVASALR